MADESSNVALVGDQGRAGAAGAAQPERPPRALTFPRPGPEPTRLPKLIAGGFKQVGEDLERRSREWTNMVRLLEQHRLYLESAEAERDRLNEALAAVMPEVEESERALRDMLETSKSGDISGDLATAFDRSTAALSELERVSTGLSANFLWCRSAWEQYARSVIRAQQMREDKLPPAR